MKLTKQKLKELIQKVIKETKAEGYDDPAYRATVKQFKGKKVSKEKFAQALAMHHQSMKESQELDEKAPQIKGKPGEKELRSIANKLRTISNIDISSRHKSKLQNSVKKALKAIDEIQGVIRMSSKL